MLEHYLEEFTGSRSCLVFLTHSAIADVIRKNEFVTKKHEEFVKTTGRVKAGAKREAKEHVEDKKRVKL